MFQKQSKTKYPYTFTDQQIDILARTVGDERWYSDNDLRGVNTEIGIAPTREVLSAAKKKIKALMGKTQESSVTLWLTDEERDSLLRIIEDPDMRRILSE